MSPSLSDTFFEKFELFADAPDAVEKMRELVLELAVQGKLTTGAHRVDPSETANTSAPFLIPGHWKWTTLAALGDTRPRNDAADNLKSSFVPMTLIPTEYGKKPGHEVRPWGEIKKGYTHLKNGDVVMAKITPCFENGKSAIMSGLAGNIGAGTTELHVFRNHGSEVLPEFVLIYLKTRRFIARGENQMTGSAGQKRVPHDYFSDSPFPLPPLAEQKRIVAKVDELMALCDRLEVQLKARNEMHAAVARASLARFSAEPTAANLNLLFHRSYTISPDELRKTILMLAVQGKLVSQNPEDERAVAAVDRILQQRECLISAKQIRRSQIPSPNEKGLFEIPISWVWTNLGNAMLNVTDGFHSTPKTLGSGVPYITAKHVKPGLIDFDSCLYVSQEDFAEIASKTRPRKGDVLVVNIGAGCGLSSIIQVDHEFAFKNVAILNRPDDVDPRFLFSYLVFRREDIFEERTKGGAQPFLSLGLIREIPFPLPPLAEQRRIVAKVDQLMALVDQLEQQLTASRATAEKLLDAVVAELTAA